MPVKLTKTTVAEAAPGDRDYFLWDSALPGFGLKVTPKGARTYVLQYRPKHSKGTRRYTIGKHDAPWTTEMARKSAAEILARVRLGEDPFLTEKAARQQELEAAVSENAAAVQAEREAFDQVVEDFIERYAKRRNRSWEETRRILRADAVRVWDKRPLSSITRADVRDLIDEVEERSQAAARALFAQLRKLFGWCVDRQMLDLSPTAGLKGPPPSKARDRCLNDEEIALFLAACDSVGGEFGAPFKVLLLTGQRLSEVFGMAWPEVNLSTGEWTIPARRAKNGRQHMVDLTPPVIKLLDSVEPGSGFVFTTTGDNPLWAVKKAKARVEVEMRRLNALRTDGKRRKIFHWRLHDLRRTAATGMARLGHAPHVIEAILNHSSGSRGGVVAIYQHYTHRPERRAALLAWAQHVERVPPWLVDAPEAANSNRSLMDVEAEVKGLA